MGLIGKMKIYLASSWRNEFYEPVREKLIKEGFEVYDFKDEKYQFHWGELDPHWKHWSRFESVRALETDKAKRAFASDFGALKECDALVLLNPSGKSAHLEAGFAIGAKKPVFIYKHNGDPELMYLMADGIFINIEDIIEKLKGLTK